MTRGNARRGQPGWPVAAGVVVVAAWLALVAPGCSSQNRPSPVAKGPVVAKVVVSLPGFSPEEVDETVCSFFLGKAPAVALANRITCISREGSFEAYAEADPDVDTSALERQVLAALPRADLPEAASSPVVSFIKTGVPKPTPKLLPEIKIAFNHEKLAALGISAQEANEQVAKALSGSGQAGDDDSADRLEALKTLRIKNATGQPVPLTGVATLELAAKPDCIVRNCRPN